MTTTSRCAAKVEQLEVRRLLAATAGAVLAPDGTLTVTGTSGDDTINMLPGSNVVVVNGTRFDFGDDYRTIQRTTVRALGGNDHITASEGFGNGNMLIDAGAGNDEVYLDHFRASVIGGMGDDLVRFNDDFGLYSLASFEDAGGIDTFDFDLLEGQPQTFDMNQYPTLENVIGARFDVIGNSRDNYIEMAYEGTTRKKVLGGAGNDTLVSSADPEYFDGGAGDDTFNDAEGGNVYYSYTYPSDTFVGGSGSDTIDYSHPRFSPDVRPLTIDLSVSPGRASVPGFVLVLLTNVENATGGSLDDTLIGDANRNILNGGAGNDTITGNGGKDVLIGGPGNDVFYAQDKKRDQIFGDDGSDSGFFDRQDKLFGIEAIFELTPEITALPGVRDGEGG